MKRKTRSTTSRCLFCFGKCIEVRDMDSLLSNLNSDLIIPGAVHCLSLKKQLLNLFVLRTLLGIEGSWCEETLKTRSAPDEESQGDFKSFELQLQSQSEAHGGGGGLDCWFQLCMECWEQVAQAWKIQQKLLVAQSNLEEVVEQIRTKMKEEMSVKSRLKKIKNSGETDDQIRKMVFPDLSMEMEPEPMIFENDGHDIQWDVDFGDNSNGQEFLPPGQEEQEEDSNNFDANDFFSNIPELNSDTKRKRGRPKKGSYSKYHSRLGRQRPKRKFHWKDCPHCDTRFRDIDGKMEAHLELHKKSEELGGGEFDCPQCTFPAQNCIELDSHIRLRHIYSIKKNMTSHHCPKCDFKTKFFKTLKDHVLQKHGGMTDEELGRGKEFSCPGCSRVFSTSRSLVAHKRAAHPELLGIQKEEVQCSQCDLKFMSKHHLQAHVNNVHNPPSKFVCDDCGKGFTFLSKLERHKVTHSNLTKRDYQCEFCGVDYAHKEILVKHLKEIHPDGGEGDAGEELSCRYCTYKTLFRPALQKHMQSHKEDMGHKCEQCGRCYTNAQGLKRHIRINHSEVQVPCPYCNKTYPSVEYMKDHLSKFCKMKKLKDSENVEGSSGSASGSVQFNTSNTETGTGIVFSKKSVVVASTDVMEVDETPRGGDLKPVTMVFSESSIESVPVETVTVTIPKGEFYST